MVEGSKAVSLRFRWRFFSRGSYTWLWQFTSTTTSRRFYHLNCYLKRGRRTTSAFFSTYPTLNKINYLTLICSLQSNNFVLIHPYQNQLLQSHTPSKKKPPHHVINTNKPLIYFSKHQAIFSLAQEVNYFYGREFPRTKPLFFAVINWYSAKILVKVVVGKSKWKTNLDVAFFIGADK